MEVKMRRDFRIRWFCLGLLLAAGVRPLVAQDAVTLSCASDDDGVRHDSTIYVRGDQMRVDQGTWRNDKQPSGRPSQSMIFRLSGPSAGMLLIDHAKRRVLFLPLGDVHAAEPSVRSRTATVRGGGGIDLVARAKNHNMRLPDRIEVVSGGRSTPLRIELEPVPFHFEGKTTVPGMSRGDVPPEMYAMMTPILTIEGTALVAKNVPGADVLADFYRRLVAANLDAPGGEDVSGTPSMSVGLMAVDAWVTARGFPVVMGSDSRIRFDLQGAMAQVAARMTKLMPGASSSSFTVVNSVSTDPVDSAVFYDGGMPAGYKVEKLKPPTIDRSSR
jgi:hypothetical protein